MQNRQWILKRRPQGTVSPLDFEMQHLPAPTGSLPPGAIRVRNTVFLCAPTMRNWMDPPGNSLHPSIALGDPVMAPAAGRVIESANDRFPVGSRVSMISAWRDIDTIDAASRPVQSIPAGLTAVDALGIFGLNSLTAYFGVLRVGKLNGSEAVLVSGAAGSTGSVAAQISKLKGCYVVGIAGGPSKCRWLLEECGLDAAIDYRNQDVAEELRRLFPRGIDLFFDNVGGEILQAAVENMAKFGTIVLCGQIAGYDTSKPIEGPRNMMRLIYGSIRMQGFLMGDYRDQVPDALADLVTWVNSGKIIARSDVREGFEDIPAIYRSLFTGENNGTLLALIDPDAYADR